MYIYIYISLVLIHTHTYDCVYVCLDIYINVNGMMCVWWNHICCDSCLALCFPDVITVRSVPLSGALPGSSRLYLYTLGVLIELFRFPLWSLYVLESWDSTHLSYIDLRYHTSTSGGCCSWLVLMPTDGLCVVVLRCVFITLVVVTCINCPLCSC
jgi:hypothetical protein